MLPPRMPSVVEPVTTNSLALSNRRKSSPIPLSRRHGVLTGNDCPGGFAQREHHRHRARRGLLRRDVFYVVGVPKRGIGAEHICHLPPASIERSHRWIGWCAPGGPWLKEAGEIGVFGQLWDFFRCTDQAGVAQSRSRGPLRLLSCLRARSAWLTSTISLVSKVLIATNH